MKAFIQGILDLKVKGNFKYDIKKRVFGYSNTFLTFPTSHPWYNNN